MKDILIKQFFSKLGIQYNIENVNLCNEFAYEYIKKLKEELKQLKTK